MKYLLLVLAILVLVWLIRGARRRDAPPARAERSGDVQPMVACLHCGVHLPGHEALPGRGGVFCGEAHRAEYEKQHPAA